MPNPIKFSTGSESDALKKGNMFIGTGAVGKGPSDSTGYYQGPAVPSGGYVIYMNKVGAPGGLSYHSVTNDAELVAFTNSLAGQTFTTAQQCFNYYYGQTDKVLVNQDYPPTFPYIVMDGLVFYLDAGITQSYPGSGTAWSDINGLGPKNNGTLINGASFSEGSIVFDGADDYVNIGVGKSCNGFSGDFCISAWVNRSNAGGWGNIIGDWATQFTSLEWQLAMDTSGNLFFYNGANQFVFGFPVSSGFGRNTWINVVISRIGSSFKLYANTNLLSTRTNTSTFGSPTGNLNIGVDGDNVSERFGGLISNVLIYKNKGLTDAEITQNYNAQKGRFGL